MNFDKGRFFLTLQLKIVCNKICVFEGDKIVKKTNKIQDEKKFDEQIGERKFLVMKKQEKQILMNTILQAIQFCDNNKLCDEKNSFDKTYVIKSFL